MPDIKATRDDYENVSWDLEPSDALLFHGLRVQCAGGNLRSDLRRRGYAVRHTGNDVAYDTRLDTNEANPSETHADMDILDSDHPEHQNVVLVHGDPERLYIRDQLTGFIRFKKNYIHDNVSKYPRKS